MLVTPLGKIIIKIDDKQINYIAEKILLDSNCKDLDGRFRINVMYEPNNEEHIISCYIDNYSSSKFDDIESGDRLSLKSFYNEGCKLSIGMEGDSGYFADGTRDSNGYDYDCEYLENGVRYVLLNETLTDRFVFGLAWINGVNSKNNIQTWFGADPIEMRK